MGGGGGGRGRSLRGGWVGGGDIDQYLGLIV